MKKCMILLLLILANTAHGAQTSPIRISVTRFRPEVGHYVEGCLRTDFGDERQLQTIMEHGLSRAGLKVVERRNIREIYANEYELPNLNQKSRPRKNQFLAAQYTVNGGIAEMGICQESSGNGIQLGGIISLLGGPDTNIGVSQQKTRSIVKLVGELVSTETGEVVQTFEANAEIVDSQTALSGGAMGIGASHREGSFPPMEKATNQAIQDLARQIAGYLGSLNS